MLDLVLHAPDKATFVTFARNRSLLDGEDKLRRGVSYFWWAETGKFVTQAGEYDENGDEITPPTFLAGLVLVLRLHSIMFDADVLDTDRSKAQHLRSKVVKYIRDNGEAGTLGGWPYYELDGVKIFRPSDVEDFITSRGLTGHIWAGGNAY